MKTKKFSSPKKPLGRKTPRYHPICRRKGICHSLKVRKEDKARAPRPILPKRKSPAACLLAPPANSLKRPP